MVLRVRVNPDERAVGVAFSCVVFRMCQVPGKSENKADLSAFAKGTARHTDLSV